LQTDANAILEEFALFAGIEAQHRDVAAVSRAESFEDFDGRGFPGSVRTKKRENFTGMHVEIDAAYGLKTAVALYESTYLDRRAGRHRVDDDVTA
jgi:hypothetical protein